MKKKITSSKKFPPEFKTVLQHIKQYCNQAVGLIYMTLNLILTKRMKCMCYAGYYYDDEIDDHETFI